MDKLLKRNLMAIASGYSACIIVLIVSSWVLGTNIVAGVLGVSIGYGIALVFVLLRYHLTKSRNSNQASVPTAEQKAWGVKDDN